MNKLKHTEELTGRSCVRKKIIHCGNLGTPLPPESKNGNPIQTLTHSVNQCERAQEKICSHQQ